MHSDFPYSDADDKELYRRVKNKEILLEELSIAEVIRLTSFISSEIDRTTSRLEELYQCKNET